MADVFPFRSESVKGSEFGRDLVSLTGNDYGSTDHWGFRLVNF